MVQTWFTPGSGLVQAKIKLGSRLVPTWFRLGLGVPFACRQLRRDRQTGIEADRQAGRRADRQTGRQVTVLHVGVAPVAVWFTFHLGCVAI